MITSHLQHNNKETQIIRAVGSRDHYIRMKELAYIKIEKT